LEKKVSTKNAQLSKMQGIAIRTRFIDDNVRQHVIEGPIRQIVILGAGMDCRALRLPLPADAHVYEVDLDEVLNFKNEILNGIKDKIEWKPSLPEGNRHCIAMDFHTDEAPWKKPLLTSFQTNKPALWIMEGLLMYLTPEAIIQLFKTVSEVSSSGSFIVAQHGRLPVTTDPEGPHKLHQEINAPILSTYTIEDMQTFLSTLQFTKIMKTSPYDMGEWATKRIAESGITVEEINSGYYLFTAEKL